MVVVVKIILIMYYQYIICMIVSISQVSRWQLDSHETSDSLPSWATLQLEYWVQALVRTAQCITWNHYNTHLSIKTFLLCPILCMLSKEKCAALPLRSLLRDQGLFKRPFGQNRSLFSLFLKPKSPFQFQNITILG